jgi:SAM-dependent methyltransferase
VDDVILTFLRSEEAFALRREHAAPPGSPEPDPVRLVAELRRGLDGERARALTTQILLERRAHAKFDDPGRLLFERVALQQATSPGIARWRAALPPAGSRVVDLGCGLGADAMAFRRAGHWIVAVDRDPDRAALARHNVQADRASDAAATPVRAAIAVVGDAAHLPAHGDVLFVDPDRRTERGRVFRLADASPGPEDIAPLFGRFATVLVKAPPALPDEEIPPDADVHFLSEGGECREAMLRFGEGVHPGRRRAVLVETGEFLDADDGGQAPVAGPGAFLLDPDPALRRAGGVGVLAARLDAGRVSAGATYLFADAPCPDRWARSYRVRDVFPFRERDWKRRLAEDPPRELIVKQRGVGVEESRIRATAPRAAGGPRLALVLWADGPKRVACLCEPVDPR